MCLGTWDCKKYTHIKKDDSQNDGTLNHFFKSYFKKAWGYLSGFNSPICRKIIHLNDIDYPFF